MDRKKGKTGRSYLASFDQSSNEEVKHNQQNKKERNDSKINRKRMHTDTNYDDEWIQNKIKEEKYESSQNKPAHPLKSSQAADSDEIEFI